MKQIQYIINPYIIKKAKQYARNKNRIKNNLIVVKSNELIESSYKLSEAEHKVLALAIAKANQKFKTTKDLIGHKISITSEEYCEYFHVKKSSVYKILKTTSDKLINQYYSYIDINGITQTVPIFSCTEYQNGNGLIHIVFKAEFIPMITELKKKFTTYELQEIANLKSAYAIRIYELIMKNYNKNKYYGTFQTKINQLKWYLGLTDCTYITDISNFKKQILELAIEQINEKTELNVFYEQIEAGKKIKGFKFHCMHKDYLYTIYPSNRFKNIKIDSTPLKLTSNQKRIFATHLAHLKLDFHVPRCAGNTQEQINYIYNHLSKPSNSEYLRKVLLLIGLRKNINYEIIKQAIKGRFFHKNGG